MTDLLDIAAHFISPGLILDIRVYGQGNVHDTFLVSLASPGKPHLILQRLNTRVFPEPLLVMGNLRLVTAHLGRRLKSTALDPGRRFEVPQVLLTHQGQDHLRDSRGGFWRALSFIEGAVTSDTITDLAQAQEVGYALGLFHRLLSDLPPEHLPDTLPGFHLTPLYLQRFDEVWAAGTPRSSPEVAYCCRVISRCRGWAAVLEDGKATGWLTLRVIHGDPKVNNVLFDQASGQAVSLIDLDTVKPGLVHYDLGDCLRSACNPLGEETQAWEQVRFAPEWCRAVLTGYFSQARQFFTTADHAYLFDAVRLLPFELGLRFFTDYLAGNVYFKADHRDHNLWRALVQFRLTESIEEQAGTLRAIMPALSSCQGE